MRPQGWPSHSALNPFSPTYSQVTHSWSLSLCFLHLQNSKWNSLQSKTSHTKYLVQHHRQSMTVMFLNQGVRLAMSLGSNGSYICPGASAQCCDWFPWWSHLCRQLRGGGSLTPRPRSGRQAVLLGFLAYRLGIRLPVFWVLSGQSKHRYVQKFLLFCECLNPHCT